MRLQGLRMLHSFTTSSMPMNGSSKISGHDRLPVKAILTLTVITLLYIMNGILIKHMKSAGDSLLESKKNGVKTRHLSALFEEECSVLVFLVSRSLLATQVFDGFVAHVAT